jgi:hypothetical protein
LRRNALATLKNATSDLFIVLDLRKTSEFPKWIGYDLKILVKQDSKIIEFAKLYNTDELSFENYIEPEIPYLYNSLDALTRNKISSYVFEPIDEKDFCLEIIKENSFYKVNLFMEESLLFGVHYWKVHSKIGIQIKVEKDAVLSFTNDLKKEFFSLNPKQK